MDALLAYVRRHHLALVALFVALGGTSYAAIKLPENSVGTRQIRRGAVTLPKLARSARPKAGSPGPAGPVGPKGDPGTAGQQGIQGAPGPGATPITFTVDANNTTNTPVASLGSWHVSVACEDTFNDMVLVVDSPTADRYTLTRIAATDDASPALTTQGGTIVPGGYAPSTVTFPGSTHYTRAEWFLVLADAQKTLDVHINAIADHRTSTRKCVGQGTAVPAS